MLKWDGQASKRLRENATLTLLLYVMSHTALGPETMAIASNLLREPLRCRELLPLQPSPTCARHLGLLVLLTGANQHHVIPPASYGGVYDIYPRTQSAVTTMWGVLGGRAVNLPILFGHQFSHIIGSPHSRVNLFLFSTYSLPKLA